MNWHDPDARIIGHKPGLPMNVYPPQMPFCQADVGMVNVCVCVSEWTGFWGVPEDITFSSLWLIRSHVQLRVEYHYTLRCVSYSKPPYTTQTQTDTQMQLSYANAGILAVPVSPSHSVCLSLYVCVRMPLCQFLEAVCWISNNVSHINGEKDSVC